MASETTCYSNTEMGKESGDNIRCTRAMDNKFLPFIIGALLLTAEKHTAILKSIEVVC